MIDVVCAGHVCVDFFPLIPTDPTFKPGRLFEVGPATIYPGGSVANTGAALRKLGAEVRLVARFGDDGFGHLLQNAMDRVGLDLGSPTRGAETGYSFVLSTASMDRTFLHYAGGNSDFCAADLPARLLGDARALHFGYPPLMRRMCARSGEELRKVFARARRLGLLTSLDMSVPDPAGKVAGIDWPAFYAHVLPECDLFSPSLDEARATLGPGEPEALAERFLELGARIVGLKLGADGLLLAAGDAAPAPAWRGARVREAAFEVEVAGTAGAGDAASAGLLFSLLRGDSPAQAARVAAAVGAACVEAEDAASGVPDWPTLQARLALPWPKRAG